jgi:hypothetical protein
MTVQVVLSGQKEFKGAKSAELKDHPNMSIIRDSMIHNSSAFIGPD